MSSDLRLHIASLAAVFFALGIGILIGTAFVGTPVVERQTNAVVRQLNRLIQRQDATIGELRRATQAADKNEAALRALLPRLVAGTLAGRRVLVVQTGDYAEAAEQAAEALRNAGASVTQVALPNAAWLPPEGAEPDRERRIADAARLAAELAAGNPATLADFRRGALLAGETPDWPLRLVVLVGGGEAPSGEPTDSRRAADRLALVRERDVTLVKTWQAAGIAVVGAEPLEADVSVVREFQALGLATVDNVDRAAGQISLPFALRGEVAAYGMKPTAERILPPSLTAPVTQAP